MDNLDALAAEAKTAIAEASDVASLDDVRVQFLGKKGRITGLLKGLGKLSAEERPKAGAQINVVKQELQEAINTRRSALEADAIAERLASETIDVTLPGRGHDSGGLHPVTHTIAIPTARRVASRTSAIRIPPTIRSGVSFSP